ncbi:MAG: hypothetical protein PHT76_12695 [Anaerostipes sp.]|nr:hypothetical protein [Anaerostipes sp.]
MDKITDAYLRYYSNRNFDDCEKTNEFIKKYQQELSSSGYGYINFASYIQHEGKGIKLKSEFIQYYLFLVDLKRSNSINQFEAFIYIEDNEYDPLNIVVDAEKHQPDQSWHIIVSYLGFNVFAGVKTQIHSVSCPEFWLGMIESVNNEKNFIKKEEFGYLLQCAIDYKRGVISCSEWKNTLKPYRQKLHGIVMKE